MAVIRVQKTKNYTTMSNYHLREKGLSMAAKGLMSLMLSLPDNWDYSVAGLVAISKEGKTGIKSMLNELRTFGYLKVTKLMPNQTETGRIEYIYDVFECPQKQDTEKQGTVFLDLESQDLESQDIETQGIENRTQLNTKESITNKSNTNKVNTRFIPPKLEEVRAYCLERKNGADYEYFYDYYVRQDWRLANGQKMKDWKAAVRLWERNNKSKKPIIEDDHLLDGILT